MATKRKKTSKANAGAPPELNLLAAVQFNTRKAVRAFVASEEYQMLAELVGCALAPDAFPGEDRLPRRLLAVAREGAHFLSGDLATLVALAARSDAKPYVPPVTSRGIYFTKRAGWLGALLAAQDDGAAAETILRQLDAIEKEEAAAWREHAAPEAA